MACRTGVNVQSSTATCIVTRRMIPPGPERGTRCSTDSNALTSSSQYSVRPLCGASFL